MPLGDPIPIPVAKEIIAYRNLQSFPQEKKEKFFKQEAEALIDWARSSTSLTIPAFCSSRGYSKNTFYIMRKESPELEESWEMARQVLAARYYEGGLTGRLHPTFTLKVLPMLDDEYLKMCKELNLNAEMTQNYEESRQRAVRAELELVKIKSQMKNQTSDDSSFEMDIVSSD